MSTCIIELDSPSFDCLSDDKRLTGRVLLPLLCVWQQRYTQRHGNACHLPKEQSPHRFRLAFRDWMPALAGKRLPGKQFPKPWKRWPALSLLHTAQFSIASTQNTQRQLAKPPRLKFRNCMRCRK